jgi:hypothetical protein
MTGNRNCRGKDDHENHSNWRDRTLTPGQTFYEGPNDIQSVDWNASHTKPAKFVVFFPRTRGRRCWYP